MRSCRSCGHAVVQSCKLRIRQLAETKTRERSDSGSCRSCRSLFNINLHNRRTCRTAPTLRSGSPFHFAELAGVYPARRGLGSSLRSSTCTTCMTCMLTNEVRKSSFAGTARQCIAPGSRKVKTVTTLPREFGKQLPFDRVSWCSI
jgi:hypothetical protein